MLEKVTTFVKSSFSIASESDSEFQDYLDRELRDYINSGTSAAWSSS